MMQLLHGVNPLILADTMLAMLRYGRGERFVVPAGTSLHTALRTLRRYGVRTYGYQFARGGARSFRVRRQQAAWAETLLLTTGVPMLQRPHLSAGPLAKMPRAWSVPARTVGWSGAVLGLFMGSEK